MSNVPTTQKEWRVQGQNGPDSLKFNEQALVPKLGDKDVLVKCMLQLFDTTRSRVSKS